MRQKQSNRKRNRHSHVKCWYCVPVYWQYSIKFSQEKKNKRNKGYANKEYSATFKIFAIINSSYTANMPTVCTTHYVLTRFAHRFHRTKSRNPHVKIVKYCVKISFIFSLFTISQSILFKAIRGHSSLSIQAWKYTYSVYCFVFFCFFFVFDCFAVFGVVTKSKAISLCRLIVKNWQAAVSQSNVNCVVSVLQWGV